jgi:hypothetical protein
VKSTQGPTCRSSEVDAPDDCSTESEVTKENRNAWQGGAEERDNGRGVVDGVHERVKEGAGENRHEHIGQLIREQPVY